MLDDNIIPLDNFSSFIRKNLLFNLLIRTICIADSAIVFVVTGGWIVQTIERLVSLIVWESTCITLG